jgi:hypothetical protein
VLVSSALARGSHVPAPAVPARWSTGRTSGESPTARKHPSARGAWAALVTSKIDLAPRAASSFADSTAFSRVLRLAVSTAIRSAGTPQATRRSRSRSGSVGSPGRGNAAPPESSSAATRPSRTSSSARTIRSAARVSYGSPLAAEASASTIPESTTATS